MVLGREGGLVCSGLRKGGGLREGGFFVCSGLREGGGLRE